MKQELMLRQEINLDEEINNNDYIEGFDLIEDRDGNIAAIDVFVSNGESFPAAYTKSNLETLRNNMLKHAKEQRGVIKRSKMIGCGYTALAVAGGIGFALINITGVTKELSSNIPATVSLGVSIVSGIGALKNAKNIAKMERNITFALHKTEINHQILENPYVFYNVDAKDKALIEDWIVNTISDEPILIENIHLLKPETVTTIWKNIKLSKQFGMKCDPEQEFQKTLKQV